MLWKRKCKLREQQQYIKALRFRDTYNTSIGSLNNLFYYSNPIHTNDDLSWII